MKVNRLSLKIGLSAAGTAGLFCLLFYFVPEVPLVFFLLGAAGVGLAAYSAAYRLLSARLDLAQSILRQIRKHPFENLETGYRPQGDELDALIRQVYRTGRALEKEMQNLRNVEHYRREYLGNVSHELKTPIFAILGLTETLLGGALADERVNRTFLEKILRNAARLSSLTRDLAEISRLESGALKLTAGAFDLQQVVREALDAVEVAAEARQIALRHRLPEALPRVEGDRERIRQVLINLIDNAVKYNRAGGWVAVGVRLLPGGEVEVAVADGGIGIAPEEIPRLTERFYRVDKSRSRDQGGTGLGLAIVKHILAAHERHLHIQSSAGQGSTFSFTLPAERPAARPARPTPAERSHPG